jgi:hypothetical protein
MSAQAQEVPCLTHHAFAGYVEKGTPPFTCEECMHFRPDNSCALVMGPYAGGLVHPADSCVRFWAPRQALLGTPEAKKEMQGDIPSNSEILVPGGYGGGDIIPALLEPGEVVLPKEQVSKHGLYDELEEDRQKTMAAKGQKR